MLYILLNKLNHCIWKLINIPELFTFSSWHQSYDIHQATDGYNDNKSERNRTLHSKFNVFKN